MIRRNWVALVLVFVCAGTGSLFSLVGTAASGELSVISDPVGAVVYIDGRFAGQTPITLSTPQAGDHRVRLVHDGYLEHSRVITIDTTRRATLSARLTARAAQNNQAAGLKIVVIEGEDAVNIIQQGTAVAPVVEVRDRNDQPVAGAVVTFAIRSGRATFNGVRTLTITTNAAGRAAVTALTPTSSGALQISASAAFQGQTAVATIAQTNVMTAAQAASAAGTAGGGGAGGSAGTSTGGAAGGGTGGGVSATTIGIVSGAAAGGALVAVKATGDSSVSGTYTGSFSGQRPAAKTFTLNGVVTLTCSSTRAPTGTLTLTLTEQSDGTVTGTLAGTFTDTMVATNCAFPDDPLSSTGAFQGPVTGTPGGLQSRFQGSGTRSSNIGTITGSNAYTFSGALNNGVISGTFTITHSESLTGPNQAGAGYTAGGTATMSVTLQ